MMNILIACERSGIVRDAFIARGHNAVSCDLEPSARPGPHLQCDVRTRLNDGWDMMIAFPDCTYLTASGLHWNGRGRGSELTEQALEFVRTIWSAPIDLIGMENPIGCISTRIRRASQIIQPYQFGEDASKATCLWLKGLSRLIPTKYIQPRIVQDGPYKGKRRWANQTDSGQNKLGPSDTRTIERAQTYQGIADAMADQWSDPKRGRLF